MGFYLSVTISKSNYRYHVEKTGTNFRIKGRNKNIVISPEGKLVEGEMKHYYLQIIYKALIEYIQPGTPNNNRKDSRDSPKKTLGEKED